MPPPCPVPPNHLCASGQGGEVPPASVECLASHPVCRGALIMIEIRPAGGAAPDRSRDQNADEIPPPASSLSATTLARTPA